jgi:hypothetical protein
MKTVKILYAHTGECSTTAPDPISLYEEGAVDMTEKVTCILSNDDWRHVSVPKWSVREVSLPDWMDPNAWCVSSVEWKYVWGMGADPNWSEAWLRGLCYLHRAERLACIKLLKTKTFRSSFRQSLRDQLVQWLEASTETRRPSPFSPKQWDCLVTVHIGREAKQLSENLYWARYRVGTEVSQ